MAAVRKFLSYAFCALLLLGVLFYAGVHIASFLGFIRLPLQLSGLGAAILTVLYLFGASLFESSLMLGTWSGSRKSSELPPSVTAALPPQKPDYYERPMPQPKPPENLTPPSPPSD